MVKPVFCGWYFRCPVCGCVAYEDDHACLCCGEPFDWSVSEVEEDYDTINARNMMWEEGEI